MSQCGGSETREQWHSSRRLNIGDVHVNFMKFMNFIVKLALLVLLDLVVFASQPLPIPLERLLAECCSSGCLTCVLKLVGYHLHVLFVALCWL